MILNESNSRPLLHAVSKETNVNIDPNFDPANLVNGSSDALLWERQETVTNELFYKIFKSSTATTVLKLDAYKNQPLKCWRKIKLEMEESKLAQAR